VELAVELEVELAVTVTKKPASGLWSPVLSVLESAIVNIYFLDEAKWSLVSDTCIFAFGLTVKQCKAVDEGLGRHI
jgi:hypothetical protein